jgi:outer membrane receptor for ferrienterochelin and colicins
VQANALSEGLCFQPGLRVESNCQTCNYSQLRMNGLGGGYSQILVNERAVFGPLVGLYGLEQFLPNSSSGWRWCGAAAPLYTAPAPSAAR